VPYADKTQIIQAILFLENINAVIKWENGYTSEQPSLS
jgi:hypothetical protein